VAGEQGVSWQAAGRAANWLGPLFRARASVESHKITVNTIRESQSNDRHAAFQELAGISTSKCGQVRSQFEFYDELAVRETR
jgi:hypothetical protein